MLPIVVIFFCFLHEPLTTLTRSHPIQSLPVSSTESTPKSIYNAERTTKGSSATTLRGTSKVEWTDFVDYPDPESDEHGSDVDTQDNTNYCGFCKIPFSQRDISRDPDLKQIAAQCNHSFHYVCLHQHLDSSTACPICYKKVFISDRYERAMFDLISLWKTWRTKVTENLLRNWIFRAEELDFAVPVPLQDSNAAQYQAFKMAVDQLWSKIDASRIQILVPKLKELQVDQEEHKISYWAQRWWTDWVWFTIFHKDIRRIQGDFQKELATFSGEIRSLKTKAVEALFKLATDQEMTPLHKEKVDAYNRRPGAEVSPAKYAQYLKQLRFIANSTEKKASTERPSSSSEHRVVDNRR